MDIMLSWIVIIDRLWNLLENVKGLKINFSQPLSALRTFKRKILGWWTATFYAGNTRLTVKI